MTKAETRPFDPAEYLDDKESIAAYMSDALESEDPAFVADALGVIARARGMSDIARQAGVSRESLCCDEPLSSHTSRQVTPARTNRAPGTQTRG